MALNTNRKRYEYFSILDGESKEQNRNKKGTKAIYAKEHNGDGGKENPKRSPEIIAKPILSDLLSFNCRFGRFIFWFLFLLWPV